MTSENENIARDPAAEGEEFPRRVKTWYGAPARVVPSDDGLCDIVLYGLPFPHPSLINGALRRGVPERAKRRLFFLHEFGHLQTLPFLALLLPLLWRRRRSGPAWPVLSLLSLEGFWELITEMYVISRGGREYVDAWRASRNPTALLFWPVALLVAVLPLIGTRRRR